MKRKGLVFVFLSFIISTFAQNDDPVVMTIGGEPVSRSEFEYNYNKNNTDAVVDKKSVAEYVDMFAVYKMKVRAAKAPPQTGARTGIQL